jgi:hypothetical protein
MLLRRIRSALMPKVSSGHAGSQRANAFHRISPVEPLRVHGEDRYGRTLATCSADGENLNAWIGSFSKDFDPSRLRL